MSVPSGWVEDGSDYEIGGFGSRSFTTPENEEQAGFISIYYSESDEDDKTPSEEMEETAENYVENFHSDDFVFDKTDEMVIDGAECEVFESTETIETDNGSIETTRHHIFVSSYEKNYEITVYGDMVSVDDLIKSISMS